MLPNPGTADDIYVDVKSKSQVIFALLRVFLALNERPGSCLSS